MRRIRIILALLGIAAGVTIFGPAAPPADAHICTTPIEISVGERVVVNIGVAAEDKPVNLVDVTIPEGFDLKDQIGYLGWLGTRDGETVHFSGSQMQPYTCTFFSFDGIAPRKGRYVATIVTHATDGTTKTYTDVNPYSQFPAVDIYAGIPIPDAGVTPGGKTGGLPNGFWLALAVAVIAGGVAVAFAYTMSRRGDADSG